ncbi:MAG: hypothetical protein ACM3MM_07875 [Acidobacteriota bacterium]
MSTDDFVAIAHDPIMAAMHDGGVFTASQYLDAAFDPVLVASTSSIAFDLVAVRGDDLCLFRARAVTEAADVDERLNLPEVCDGLAVRLDIFPRDQLSQALTTLDRRWLASLGFADDHPWFAVLDWFYDADPTVMAQELPDDFRSVGHRRLSYPDGDRSQMITNINTRIEAVETVVPRYLRVTDRVALFETRSHAPVMCARASRPVMVPTTFGSTSDRDEAR